MQSVPKVAKGVGDRSSAIAGARVADLHWGTDTKVPIFFARVAYSQDGKQLTFHPSIPCRRCGVHGARICEAFREVGPVDLLRG